MVVSRTFHLFGRQLAWFYLWFLEVSHYLPVSYSMPLTRLTLFIALKKAEFKYNPQDNAQKNVKTV